ncbi:MAG: NUDIX domain-containing protein [Ilumatobacteraceae bacterium]|nr:NUDIX domain-containing protein [Ilumatobacteraceae bacterium]
MVGVDVVRRRVRADVAGRQAVDAREERSIADFIAAYDELADPFSYEAGRVHVTGSGIVVSARGVLLLRHKRLGLWLQPGGHLEPGETPWDGALRECNEETGLDLDFIGVPDRSGVPELLHVDVHEGGRGHTHLDLRYLLGGDERDPAPPEGESQEIDWFSWEAAIDRADPGLRGLLLHLADRH